MTNTPSGGRKSLGFAGSCPAVHPKTPAADDLGPRVAGDSTQRPGAAEGKNLTRGESAPIAKARVLWCVRTDRLNDMGLHLRRTGLVWRAPDPVTWQDALLFPLVDRCLGLLQREGLIP